MTPSKTEIEQLLTFLPQFEADGFKPIVRWMGDAGTMPYPEYDPAVREFFRLAGGKSWSDYGYDPQKATQMLHNEALIKKATLDEIRTMLTYCVRGERFNTGHWGAVIEGGQIARLLQRLVQLNSGQPPTDNG